MKGDIFKGFAFFANSLKEGFGYSNGKKNYLLREVLLVHSKISSKSSLILLIVENVLAQKLFRVRNHLL